MRIDSFAFLPRSFRPLFENPPRLPGHEAPVWIRPGERSPRT